LAYLYQVIGFDSDYFWKMNINEKVRFVMDIQWVDRLRLIKHKFIPLPKNDVDGYQSRNLNAWGDETSNTLRNRSKKVIDNLKKNTVAGVFSHDDKVWGAISDFVKSVREGGGDVVLTYPNIYSRRLDTKMNSSFFSELARRAEAAGVKLIGTPNASRYDESLLFDSFYHQNQLGQSRATDRLFEDLHRAGFI
jgi:hypothetical protein